MKDITLFSRVTFLDVVLFSKHMSIMLKSGITIVEALDILADQTKSSAFKKVITAVSTDIKNGKTFAKALARHPKAFSSFYISLIEIGESSGTLDDNLIYLAKQLAKDYNFRKKVKGALMYPIIVFVAAAIVGISISLFALPKLVDMFKDFDVELPVTTRILIFISNVMKDYGIFIVIGFVLFIILFQILIRLRRVKPVWDAFLLEIPLFGGIIQNAELAAFCRSMGVMLKSGLPITTALDIEQHITTNSTYKGYTKKLLAATEKGKALSQELTTKSYRKMPLIAIKMIAVGEKTGKLDETLLYLGDFFEDEVDDATKNISTVLEPVMLLVIGLIVAFIALAIISPIYELTGSIKR